MPHTRFRNLVLALTAASATAVTAGAAEYASKEKGFAVTFPAPPKATTRDVPAGAVAMTQVMVELKTQAYLVVCVDWKTLDDDADLRLDAQRDAMLAQPGGKLLSEKKVTLAGRPGREIEMSAVNNLAGVNRFYLDAKRNRRYTLMVISRKPRLDGAVVAAFLDSFQLLENK